jgi:peroxiredoxin
MAAITGQQAPAFSLYDSDKNLVSLSDFQGKKVLILFFPLAFSSVCTAELCSVRDNIAQYNHSNATVIGISVDSLYTLKEFKKAQQLNFTLLSDFNKKVSEEYDCLHETFSYGMKGVSKRSAFIIGEDGKVVYREVLENPGLHPDFVAINKALESF